MGASDAASVALGSVVHIIQVALTPVFLLSGVATLLNVFSTRLARVADQVDAAAKLVDGADATTAAVLSLHLKHLHRRSLALDAAVALGAVAGALTCTTVLALFVGESSGLATATILFVTFGLALVCTLAAIGAYAAEMLMASKRIRAEVAAGRQLAEPE
jgi:type IV secretory pathway VirB6-like protein